MPGGIATAVTAIICGRLLNGEKPIADSRVLIAIGISLFLVSMYQLGHLTTLAGEPDVRAALIIRGAGLGFLFTPINNVAYGSLEPHEAQQASGLINLSRQLGGSFGIAILANYVMKHTQIHRVDLVTDVAAGSPLTIQRLQALQIPFIKQGMSSYEAQHAAIGLLDKQITLQAAMLSYNDAWILLLLTFVAVSPAILLLKRPKHGLSMGGGH